MLRRFYPYRLPLRHGRGLGLGLALALLTATVLANTANLLLFSRSTVDLRAESRAAAAEGKALAVFLTQADCPACREMERDVHPRTELQKSFNRHFRSVRIDISQSQPLIDPSGQETTPAEFARRLRAVATPSYAFFSGNGQLRYRYTGKLDAAEFGQLTRYVAKGDYENRPFATKPARTPGIALQAQAPAAALARRPEIALSASDGKHYRLSDFRGQVVALAVGYTTCPDVCPTTLLEMQAAVNALPARLRPRVQLLFATLDPERDSLAILKEYAAAFQTQGGRPLLGLRGSPEETRRLISELQLVAEKQPIASLGYTLDHTTGVFLFDLQGQLQGFSPYGQPVAELSSDLARLAGKTPAPQRSAFLPPASAAHL